MSWAHPLLLWLLAGLVGLAALSIWWRWWLRQRLARLGSPERVGVRRERLRLVLLWCGLAGTIAALAGPRWGSVVETRSATGADVVLLLDCSRSMMAEDLYPNRLEAARRKAQDLLRLAPGTRMALMPFAAVPVLRCPLTGDHQAIGEMLKDCSPDLFPAESGYQGTAIGTAVREALTVLGRQVERGQALVVMSDGADDNAESVRKAAEAAKAAGVPVLGLFLADPDKTAKLVLDGQEEVMTADRSSLELLAKETGGLCVNAVPDDRDVKALAEHLERSAAARPWEERRRTVASERFQWFLLPALLCLAAGALLPTRRRLP